MAKARILVPGVLVLGLLVGALWVWRAWRAERPQPRPPAEEPLAAPAEDPRLLYSGPFHNIKPDVRYVGDAACVRCHAEIAETYRHHPMARALAPSAAVARSLPYDSGHHNPFQAVGSRFLTELRGDRLWQRQVRLGPGDKPVYERETEAQYAIGSGTHGYSYLTEHDGYLFQTPISWFSQQQLWDLSPGFKDRHVTSRHIDGGCLFCHANQAHFREESVNHYDTPIFDGMGIGCERCHGPGERHVRSSRRDDIVNPRRLEPSLREAVCQQCHLSGEARFLRRGRHLYDFRPGLPLSSCWAVFVWRRESEEGRKAVNHVEQMYVSHCFRGSKGEKKLGCISCHDPHVAVGPEQRVSYFRNRCLKCHKEGIEDRGSKSEAPAEVACSAPAADRRAKADSCIDCHMQRYGSSDIAHTAVTDHRILRRPLPASAATAVKPEPVPSEAPWAGLPIVPFYRDELDPKDKDVERDVGIGLLTAIMHGKVDPSLNQDRALRLLDAAARRDPTDADAWEKKAHALLLRHRPEEALSTLEAILQRYPERESVLAGAAALAESQGAEDRALAYWRRAVTANPWMHEYRGGLAPLLAKRGDWAEARTQCREWLRLAPESLPARLLWVRCLLRGGDRQEARAELDKLAALKPEDRQRLEAWFAEQQW
jgi:predicted CXXCH cytochrome family protein